MSAKPRAQLTTETDANLGNNTTRDISPTDVRESIQDVIDSALMPEDIGTTVQAWDVYLDQVKNLTPADDDFLQFKVDRWTNSTPAQAKADMALAIGDVSGLVAALAEKAPLDSPALTGVPTAPTPTLGDTTTKIATMAAVAAEVAAGITGYKWKTPVEVMAVDSNGDPINVTLSGEQTIDGVLTSTNRIGLPGQTDPAENGIWVTAAGAWARATDMDDAAEFPNATFMVRSGDEMSGTQWKCNNTSNPTVGTTAIVIEQIGAGLQLDYASQAEAEAGTDNTKVMTPLTTSQQQVKFRKDMGLIYAEDFGAIVKNNQASAGANLTTIHAARDYIIANDGVGEVVLPSGRIYINAPLTWRTGVTFAGQGRSQTFLTLADGSDCDLVQTIGFNTYAMERTNHATKVAISRFGLRDIFLDGNKGNQTIGAQGDGNLISIYGHSYIIERVNGMNAKAFGFWSEYGGSAPANFNDWGFNYAPQLRTICFSFCNAGGLVNRGPNDCMWQDVISQFNGIDGTTSEAGGTYLLKGRGVDIESGSYPTHGTIYDGGGQYNQIHSFSNFGLNVRSNTWIKGGLIETEGSNGGNVKFESGPVTTQTAITQLISYAPNVDNNTGVNVVDVQQPRVSIGMLRIRMDAPTTGSAPYSAMTGLNVAADHFSCPDVHVDGLSVNRTTTGIKIADNVEHFHIAGLIKDMPTVDATNQLVNGSFGLHLGNAKRGFLDLSMENVAVMFRRNSSSSAGNRGRITGVLTSGQLAIVGNASIDTVYSADQFDFSYDDNGTLIVYDTSTGPLYKNAVTSNTTFVVPAGTAIESIFIVNTTANAVTGGVRIGTTSGAADVVVAQAVGASAVVHIADAALLKRLFSTSAGQTLFLQAVTSWNSASLNIRVTLKRLY